MSPNAINLLTNIVGFLLFIWEPVRAYLTSQTFNWTTFGICILSAIVAYFTGKSTLNAMKPPIQMKR
jgi:hypothetical protein